MIQIRWFGVIKTLFENRFNIQIIHRKEEEIKNITRS